MFLAPKFFGGGPPEFLKSIYKIDTGSNHVAKFRGDRPRELRDYALKEKKKHHEHFTRPPVTTYGRPNYSDYWQTNCTYVSYKFHRVLMKPFRDQTNYNNQTLDVQHNTENHN